MDLALKRTTLLKRSSDNASDSQGKNSRTRDAVNMQLALVRNRQSAERDFVMAARRKMKRCMSI